MTIGSWVRRPEQKWHRVESVIADEPVTHCGRRLKTRFWHDVKEAFDTSWGTPDLGDPDRCKRCV